MANIDPVTGMPRQPAPGYKKQIQEAKDRFLFEEALQLNSEIESKAGKKLIAIIYSQLASRIDTLARQDPQCQVYLKLLSEMSTKIEVGKEAAKRLTGKFMTEVAAP